MSNINVSIEQINRIEVHPNADRLEIAYILGTQTIVPKGMYAVYQKIIFFPPDILIHECTAEILGVKKYLKYTWFNGVREQCRVAACRIRGVPSYGFIIPASDGAEIGTDVSGQWQAQKYAPPVISKQGDNERDDPAFHQYTEIENIWKYPNTIPSGTPVRITEKLHGTNCRIGKIHGELMCGSHHCRKKEYDANGIKSLYWRPVDSKILALLEDIEYDSGSNTNVIIYGEIYGPGIQDLDYGILQGQVGFRVFDISVDGIYLNYQKFEVFCRANNVETVPLLYLGPFQPGMLQEWTNGESHLEGRSKFKGREGCVITPLEETYSTELSGRLILKSVSADYLDRKKAQDN